MLTHTYTFAPTRLQAYWHLRLHSLTNTGPRIRHSMVAPSQSRVCRQQHAQYGDYIRRIFIQTRKLQHRKPSPMVPTAYHQRRRAFAQVPTFDLPHEHTQSCIHLHTRNITAHFPHLVAAHALLVRTCVGHNVNTGNHKYIMYVLKPGSGTSKRVLGRSKVPSATSPTYIWRVATASAWKRLNAILH